MHLAYEEVAMDLAYNDVGLLFEAERETPARADSFADRAPDMPLIGFFLASAVALPLWGLIAWTTWALLG